MSRALPGYRHTATYRRAKRREAARLYTWLVTVATAITALIILAHA